jgi:hypothetical protein
MFRYLSISMVLATCVAAGTLRAATKPHAGPAATNSTWTNEKLERLSRFPGLISVVRQTNNEDQDPQDVDAPASQRKTQDPALYAGQAAALRARLAAQQAELRDFTQALEDARELNTTTPGINLDEADIGITPEATIDILQNRVRQTQGELDALEDLARRNNIPPGVLRDQSQGVPADTAAAAAEQSQSDLSIRGADL